MPVKLEDRPVDTVRDEVIDQLIMNYSHGEISLEAFERRLDAAMSTDDNVELKALVEDLDMQVDEQYLHCKKDTMGIDYGQQHDEQEDVLVSVLGDKERSGPWVVGSELTVYNVLSSTKLDFSQAKFTSPSVRIKTVNVLSDMKIHVPEHVNVISRAFCIVGSIKNKASSNVMPGAPTIYIDGYSVLADIKISIKRVVRDKWLNFADSLKSLFN